MKTTHYFRNERLTESDSDGGKSSESSIRHKIVMMGAAKVGKSAIINQFLYNTFTPKYKRTVEEMHHGDFNVSGVHLTLDILDTSGSYEFPAMRDLSIKSADAFVLVYDVNDSNTFLEIKTLRAQILNTKGSVPIVIVGNKIDLMEAEHEVSFDKIIVEFFRKFFETNFFLFSKEFNSIKYHAYSILEKFILLKFLTFKILKEKFFTIPRKNEIYRVILQVCVFDFIM